jgi:hypothetical protein
MLRALIKLGDKMHRLFDLNAHELNSPIPKPLQLSAMSRLRATSGMHLLRTRARNDMIAISEG